MGNTYESLFSPLQIGDVLLKSRLSASNALPHFLQGPEPYPTDAIIDHLARIARNGATIVTFADWTDPALRKFSSGDICRFPVYDLADPSTANYMNQLTDAIHFYGSKASIALSQRAPAGYGVYDKPEPEMPEMFKERLEDSGGLPQGNLPGGAATVTKSGRGQKLLMKVMAHAPQGKAMPPLPFALGPQKALYVDSIDADGRTHRLECDSVGVCGGMTPLRSEALAYARATPRIYILGDSAGIGSIQTSMRSAYGIASTL